MQMYIFNSGIINQQHHYIVNWSDIVIKLQQVN